LGEKGDEPMSAVAWDAYPNERGWFGEFGGRFVPETLMHPLEELTEAFEQAIRDPQFHAELEGLLRDYVGRPTPLYFARRLTEYLGGAKIYLKREDLAHTGAHKINNTIGQALLTKRMGKPRVIAETGAGQHGVATATAAALLGLECVIYMGELDMERQRLNVFRMKLLGAKVVPVRSGSRTLKDAINEALRDWVTNVRTTHYILGINTFIIGQGGNIGIGFALPINEVKRILDRLLKGGRITRGALGVVLIDANSPEAREAGIQAKEGAVIVRMSLNSPAYIAGLRPGDVIVKFNGVPVKDASHLKRLVLQQPGGAEVEIEALRGNQRLKFKVKLGSR
jgi:hypothetical protein